MKSQKTASRRADISGQSFTSFGWMMGAIFLFIVVIPKCTGCKDPIYYFIDDPSDLSHPMYHQGPTVEEMLREKQ